MPSLHDTSKGTIFRLFRSDPDQEEIVAFDSQGIKTGNFPVFPQIMEARLFRCEPEFFSVDFQRRRLFFSPGIADDQQP